MFENPFAPKPRMTPQEFVSKLVSTCFDPDMNGDFYNRLKLTVPQRKRYVFSTFLFTLTLPTRLAISWGRTDLETFITTAFTLMLDAWQNPNTFVQIGDFVITEHEHIRLVEFLEKRFQQRVSVENIQNHKIQMGILLSATALIRGDQTTADIKEIVASSPKEKHYANLICKYGIRLESYICEDFSPERYFAGRSSRTMTFAELAEQYFRKINAVFKML
jgi:hypothetical protein